MKVISLCDFTGNFVRPWVDAGHEAVLVDPQHLFEREIEGVTHLPFTVEAAIPRLALLTNVAFVAAFPPCTDLAVSGARWFKSKGAADPLFQAKAVAVAEQCRTFARMFGVPYFIENPVSVLSSVWGSPDHTFDPWQFTALEPGDNYTKKTCLWTGGGFKMPPAALDPDLAAPDDRIHKAPPGPERANFRSATPMGFSRAVFQANQTDHRPEYGT